MARENVTQQWEQNSQKVGKAMEDWRKAHPKATLAEIEAAVDEQMHWARARLIEEITQASPSEQERTQSAEEACPACGERMQSRGTHQRRLQTQGGQEVSLRRQYQSCPCCGYSFFPPG